MFKNKKLAWILIISFIITVGYAFIFRINPVVDAKAYDKIAQNILAGNGFVEDPSVPIAYDSAIVRVGPLYQYFLAAIYKVFGRNFEIVWILQALLHTATAYIVYHLSLITFKKSDKRESIALWSAAIIAFYPDLIEISAMLMTETLYMFLWVLFIWLFVAYIDRQEMDSLPKKLRAICTWIKDKLGYHVKNYEWIWVLVLGLVSGVAVLARPPVLFVLPLVFIYFWARKKWALSVLYFLMLALVFVPWTVRNYNQFDLIMPFGGAGNYNFWIGNHVGASGEQETGEEIAQFLIDNGAIALYQESVPRFIEFVKEYPADFARLTLLRISRYFSVIRPMGFWFYDSGWSQFAFILSSAAASVFLFVMSLVGIIKLWAKRNQTILKYLLWMIVLTPLILFITVVETRYRFQIYPLLALFAGYGLVDTFKKGQWFKDRVLYVAILLVGLNGLIDLLLSLDKLKERLRMFL